MTEVRDRQKDVKLAIEQQGLVDELKKIVNDYNGGIYIPVTPASWYFERFSILLDVLEQYKEAFERSNQRNVEANVKIGEHTAKAAEWICKYKGEEARFLQQNRELAETKEREKKLREAIEGAIDAFRFDGSNYRADILDQLLATLYPLDKEEEAK